MVDSAARRWKVVLACGWCQGVVLAVVQNFALLAAALFSRLQMSATDTGLLLNCHAGVSCLSVLAAGGLLRRHGARKMAALGGALLALGVALSGQAASFGQLLLCYGFVSSVGAGLLLASTGVALGAGCGGAVLAAAGAAPVAAPALVSGLLARYGLQGAALLCGGVCLHCVAAALLLRPEHRGKSTSKEGGQSKDSQPTVRRGTIVPVMKIDAPEDEEKQDGRRPSSASSGPRRRGTPGWRPRQSVGSLHSGSSAGMFEDEASRSQRSSRSSSIALEPPRLHRPAGQESSVGAHSKKLDVPNLAQRGDRRGSTLSAGSHRRSQRSSLASLLSAGSSLAVVLDEHEEDGLLGARAPEERRSSGVSARSSSLEVPGEQVPGGSGGQRPWWGRLSVGSVYSGGGSRVFGARSPSLVSRDAEDFPVGGATPQGETPRTDTDGSLGSLRPPGDSSDARRQSEDSRIDRRLRGGSSGMLDLPKSYERSRQLSVSSDRSGSSGTTAGYLTAAQSLRSSGSQGSGLWWSTLSLASARSEPPITRPDEEDTATPETPPGQRRDSATPWRTPLTGAGTADLGTTSDPRPQLPGGALPEIPAKHLASGTTEDENNRAFVDPQPTDLANTLINNTPVTQEDNSCLISSSNVQPRLLQGNPSTNSMIPEDSVRLSGTTEDESNLNPVHSNQMDVGNTSMTFSMGTQEDTPGLTSSSIQPQLLSENLPDISVTPDDALLSVGESGEDETNLPTAIPQPLLPRENMSIKNMLATQEDTSDLGSSDSEEDSGNDSKEPEAIAEEPKYEGARDEKATSLGFAAPFEAHVNPFIYTETYENEEHPKDVPVTLENSSYTKGYMGDFSKGNEYGAAFVEGKNDYHTHEENNTIFYQPKNKVHHISLEKSNDKTKMTESLSINSSVPTDVTMTGNHDLSFNEDVNNTTSADIAGEPEITDNLEVLGNSVEHFTNPNVSGESEEKECLLPENKTTNTKESNYVISRTTANSFGKPSERYSIIVSVPDEAGSSPTPFGLDLAALRDFPRACLLLGLALAQCADVNHAFFTPLMLAGDLAPLLLVVVAAADLAARVLLPVGLDGFHPSPRAVCLAGFLLLVASRTVLTLTMETSGMLMACVFLGASRGVKAAYLPTAAPADNFWTSLCLQMASQGVVFIVLGPLTGYLKDWNGSYDASVLAINIATVVGMLLCCVEYLRPAS